MPIVNVPGVGQVNFPDSMSQEDIINAIENDILKKPEPGFIDRSKQAFKTGLEQIPESIAGIELGGRAALGQKEEASRQAAAIRAQEQQQKPIQAITYEELEKTYGKDGAIEVLKKLPSYISEQILQSAPSMAVPLAAAAAVTPFTTPVGGLLAGIGTYGAQQFGQFMRRQAQEGATGETLAPGKAAAVAAATAPIGFFADKFLIGLGKFPPKILGSEALAELAKRTGQSLPGRITTGATLGVIAEAPTEVLEQMAERYQAGLPLDTEDAYKEYKEAFAGAAAVGGVGGAAARALGGQPAMPKPEEESKGLPTPMETLPLPNFSAPPQGMDANRALAMREEAIQADEQRRLAQQMAEEQRMADAQERARSMQGFATPAGGNLQMMGQVRADQQAAIKQQQRDQAAAEKARLKQIQDQIKEINNTVYSTDPVANQIMKQRLLDQFAEQQPQQQAIEETPAEITPVKPTAMSQMAGFASPATTNQQMLDASRKRQADEIKAAETAKKKRIKEIENTVFSPDPLANELAKRKILEAEGLVEPAKEEKPAEILKADENQEPPPGPVAYENIPGQKAKPPVDQATKEEDRLTLKALKEQEKEIRSQIFHAKRSGTNLRRILAGRLDQSELSEFGDKNSDADKKLISNTGGASLDDIVADGLLNEFLPIELHRGTDIEANEVAEESADKSFRATEYVRDLLRTNQNMPYQSQQIIRENNLRHDEVLRLIDRYLSTEEINILIQEAIDEQARIDQAAGEATTEGETGTAGRGKETAGEEEVKEEKPKPEKQAPAETPAGQPPILKAPPDLKLKRGRNEQVVLAARELAAKKITREEFDRYVDYYTPIAPVLGSNLEAPIDSDLMFDILTTKIKQKKPAQLVNAPIKEGTRVGLRMDIPALDWGRANGVNGSVVSVHEGTSPNIKNTGNNISYRSTGHIKNVVFAPRDQERSFSIAQNIPGRKSEKTPQQTIEGNWINTPSNVLFKRVKSLLNDPEWTQVSLDPLRHAYFYDRASKRPVESADEVLQVGRFVLAKNVKYGERESFKYSLNPDIGTDTLQLSDFAGIKDAKTLLEKYVSLGKDQGLKDFANMLLQSKRLKDIDVNFVQEGDIPVHGGVAKRLSGNAIAVSHTDKTGTRVYFRMDKPDFFNESTLVHEVFHSMTEAALDRNPTMRRELVGLTREMSIGLRDLGYLVDSKDYKELSKFWDMAVGRDAGEMLAYSLTSPAFRQVFSKMAANGRPFGMLSNADMESMRVRQEKPTRPGEKPSAPKGLTAWQRIVDFVRRLLGMAPNNQKAFEQALIKYQEELKRHEDANDTYNKQLKEYDSIAPLKGTLDKYLKDLIADAEAKGLAMEQGESVTEAAKAPWGQRDMPDSYGREKVLSRMYSRMRSAYDESYSTDEAYEAAYENATGPEKSILRQLKKDDFLGFDYPHQAIQGIIENPDAYEMSTPLKVAISRLGNNFVVSSSIFGKEEARPAPTNVGQQAMEILSGMGRDVKPPEPGYAQKVRQSWDNAKDNPKATAEAARDGFRRFSDQVQTWAFSSDAALNNQIRREIMGSMLGQEEKIGLLLNTSLSQTFHSDAIANLFLRMGDIKYNKELHKWEGVEDKNNFITLSQKLDEIGAKYGLDKAQIELVAHTAFEAKRTKSLVEFNTNLDAQVQELRDAAAEERAKGNAVKASALSEKASSMRERAKFIHMDEADIQAGLSQFQLMPELNQAVEIWNGIRGNAVDKLVESGLWTPDEAEFLLSNADYVPFFREDQLENGKGPKEFMRSLQVQAKERRLKGSAKPVNDIFDNMIRWTQYAVNRSVRNRSALSLATTAESVGLARKVEGTKDGDNVVRVWDGGQEQYYDMEDPMFMEAFQGLESVSIPTIRWMAKMADILRSSVVLNPLFALSQVPQDSFAAMFSSGLKPQFALTIPVRAVKEFIQTLRGKSTAHEELKNFGVVGVRDFSSAMVRLDTEIAAGLKPAKGLWGKVKDQLSHFAMASDNAVRQATYTAALDQGLSKAEALEKAFEIFNVRRRGTSKMLSLAGQVIPFFNAYLAAQNVAYRTITGVGTSPTQRDAAYKVLFGTTASVFALSVLYAMMNGDDEDYMSKPTPTRDRLLMIPGTGMSIPLRADLYALPKVVAEHTYMILTDKGYSDGAKFRASLKSLLATSILSPTPVPQAVKPLAEVLTNYDFFQQKPLVGTYQKKKEIERQFDDNTSELAKVIGRADVISPIAVDHLVRGLFGSAGGLVLYATNPFLWHVTSPNTPRPSVSMQDALATIPNASGFVTKEYETGLKKDFFALKEEVDRAANTLTDLKQRNPEDIKDYIKDEKVRARLGLSPIVNTINTQLSTIRKSISTITNSNLPADVKAARIKQLRATEENMLKNVDLKKLREMAKI
jgi:hypothetical protein